MSSPLTTNAILEQRWLDWLREQIRLGCDMYEPVAFLRKQGFSDPVILASLEAVRPRGNALASGVLTPPLLRRAPPNLRRVASDQVQLYELDDFLGADECDEVIALGSGHLRPSDIPIPTNDRTLRTSTTADLCHLKSPLADRVDDRICRTLGIRAEYSEGIQAQRYDVGQEYKPHHDYFPPDTNLYRRMAGLRGNRTWTFMVYLDEDMQGGATRFTRIGHLVRPRRGLALLWNNLLADGSPNEATQHCGEPVTAGHKHIITKWFRVHGDGPLFHE
jgi:prolyl 4-hydroxylase